jgi:hypothetical protein
MCITPYMNFLDNGQIFMVDNRSPLFRGGGGVGNSIASNPGNGYGLGLNILADYDAAYAVNAVPEPATTLGLIGFLTLLVKKQKHLRR